MLGAHRYPLRSDEYVEWVWFIYLSTMIPSLKAIYECRKWYVTVVRRLQDALILSRKFQVQCRDNVVAPLEKFGDCTTSTCNLTCKVVPYLQFTVQQNFPISLHKSTQKTEKKLRVVADFCLDSIEQILVVGVTKWYYEDLDLKKCGTEALPCALVTSSLDLGELHAPTDLSPGKITSEKAR